MPRPLYEIAADIREDWGNKMYFGAVPYVDALTDLNQIDDKYGVERGRDIVNYFLSNANTWRGEKARAVKAELRSMVGM